MFSDLNSQLEGLTQPEEKALRQASSACGSDLSELMRFFRRTKRASQVLEWIKAGKVRVRAFDADHRIIKVQGPDGRGHKVELF